MLYLDSDIIVRKDLSSLFCLNIDSYYVAASHQLTNSLNEYLATGKLPKDFYYFNSGVMLLNLKALRENGIPARLWEDKLNHAQSFNMDEPSFNRVLGEKALHLPIIYNCSTDCLHGINIGLINEVYASDYKTLDELIHDIVIYHYVGGTDKPWNYTPVYWGKPLG